MYNNIPEWLTSWVCPKEDSFKGKTDEQRKVMLEQDKIKYPNTYKYKLHGDLFCVHKNKVPMASSNDPGSFITFEQALNIIKKDSSYGLGIGLFGSLCGVDIDHCVNDHIISPEAQEIIDYFDGAYVEYSYSGTGIHIIFLCEDQHKYQKYYTKMSKKHLEEKGITGIEGLEFYQGAEENRYLTLTGNIVPSKHPHGHSVSKDKIQNFLDKYFQKPIPTTSHITVEYTEDDEEDKAWFTFIHTMYKNPAFLKVFPTVKSLFESFNSTDHTGDESSEDLKLMGKLAFWCNNNPRVMQAAFEKSEWYNTKDPTTKGKGKDKWDSRKDYREDYCIKPAIANTHNVAKNVFKDWFYYDAETKTMNVEGFEKSKGGETAMVYPVEGKTNVYTYKDDNGIRYYAHIRQSKAGKNYVKYLNAYDCNKKEKLGDIEPKDSEGNYNSKFFEVANHFLKNIK